MSSQASFKTLAINTGTPAGVGIGLRSLHIEQIINHSVDIPWLELLIDNHLAETGLIAEQTRKICQRYPVTFHGVGLSLGSLDPINKDYLHRIKQLIKLHQSAWYSEHLCFTSFNGVQTHDLLPLPYTEEALNHLASRIDYVQDFLGQRIAIENVSAYCQYTETEMTEAEFINELCTRSDCHLLLDLNNLYINHFNLQTSITEFLQTIPLDRVIEIHLAGHEDKDNYKLDTHSRPVTSSVWQIFQQVIQQIPDVAVLIEWDNDIPTLDRLLQEAQKAETMISKKYESGYVSA